MVCRSQKREHFFGGIPADAGIGNALPVNLRLVLSAFDQMAFHHHAHNIVFAVFQLRGNILGNFHLPSVIFTAVCVAAIDHQLGRQTGLYQLFRRRFDVFGAVIRFFAAAQDNVAVGIAAGMYNGGMPCFGYRQEVMWMTCRANRIDGDFQIAVRTVLKPTGQDRPLASSRCTWLSVVRAPIAPQEIKSA